MPVARWETLGPLLTDLKPAVQKSLAPILAKYREEGSGEVSPIGKPARGKAASSAERRSADK
jgi:hypothetical protein